MDAAQQQAAAAHVAAADEVAGKQQAVAEDRHQDVDVLRRGDAAEQDDLALGADLFREVRAVAISGLRYFGSLAAMSTVANLLQRLDGDRGLDARRPALGVMTSAPLAVSGRSGSGGRANSRA